MTTPFDTNGISEKIEQCHAASMVAQMGAFELVPTEFECNEVFIPTGEEDMGVIDNEEHQHRMSNFGRGTWGRSILDRFKKYHLAAVRSVSGKYRGKVRGIEPLDVEKPGIRVEWLFGGTSRMIEPEEYVFLANGDIQLL